MACKVGEVEVINCSWRFFIAGILSICAFCLISTISLAQHYSSRIYTEADGLSNLLVYDVIQDSNGIMWFGTRMGISSYDGLTFHNYNLSAEVNTHSFSFLDIDKNGKLWAFPKSGNGAAFFFENSKWEHYTISDRLNKPVYDYTCFKAFYFGNEQCLAVGTNIAGLFIYFRGRWKQFALTSELQSNTVNNILFHSGLLYIANDKGIFSFDGKKIDLLRQYTLQLPSPAVKAICFEKSNKTAGNDKLWAMGKDWLGYFENGQFRIISSSLRIGSTSHIKEYFLYAAGRDEIYFGNPVAAFFFNRKDNRMISIDHNRGLVSDGATKIFKDREQNLWVTGYRGITKLSSRNIAGFTSDDGLFDDEVSSAIELDNGIYVFGHQGGLSFLENGKFTTISLSESLEERQQKLRVLELAKDKKGNLWMAASNRGLAWIDKSKQVNWITLGQGKFNYVNSVVVDQNDHVYAASNAIIWEISDGRRKELIRHKEKYATIRKLFLGKDNSLYFSTYAYGLVEYKNGNEIIYTCPDNRVANDIYSFCESTDGTRWVGTSAGLYKISGSVLKKVNENGLIIERPVFLILEDNKKQLWFGTDNGLYRWNGKQLDNFTVRNGLTGQEINRSAGLLDHENNLWFGTNNGLSLFQPEFDNVTGIIPPPLVRVLYMVQGGDTLKLTTDATLASNQNDPVIHFQVISFIDEQQVKYKYKLEGLSDNWSDPIPYLENKLRFTNLRPGKYRICIKACNAAGIWSKEVYSDYFRIRYPFWMQWWFIGIIVVVAGLLFMMGIRFYMLSRYSGKLEKTVAERTAMLKKSELELRESNIAKDKFLSIIAHDLKNPFNALNGMLELLINRYSEYPDEEKKRILSVLKSSTDHTIDLLENLLTWARSQKGILPFEPVKFDLNQVIEDNVGLLKLAAASKQIEINYSTSNSIMVFADRDMVSAVVRNLLSNAIKFTYAGGRVTIISEKDGEGKGRVTVTDNGHGMSEKTMSHLFKIDEMRVMRGTEGEKGTGLGLILSRDFIQRNGGNLNVKSEMGKGSSFSFTIPFIDQTD